MIAHFDSGFHQTLTLSAGDWAKQWWCRRFVGISGDLTKLTARRTSQPGQQFSGHRRQRQRLQRRQLGYSVGPRITSVLPRWWRQVRRQPVCGSGHTLLLETSVYSEAGENRSSRPPSSHLTQIRSSSFCAKRTLVTVPSCPH
jgi:hypothetical protein